MSSKYPMIVDSDEDGNDVRHPIVDLLKDNKDIENVVIVNEFRDDHCPCVEVDITIDGATYHYSDWWLSGSGLKMYHQAEVGAFAKLKEHILFCAQNLS